MGMLDAERVDSVAELSNPIRRAEDTAVIHRPVFAEITMLSGEKNFEVLPTLGYKGKYNEMLLQRINTRNKSSKYDCVVSVKIPYKEAKETWNLGELPFAIDYDVIYPDVTSFDVAKRIFDDVIPHLWEKLAEAKECYEATANHSRLVEAHECWGEDIKRYEREIEKLTKIWEPLLLADDIQECAEEDRRYKQKEQANEVIFNEGK